MNKNVLYKIFLLFIFLSMGLFSSESKLVAEFTRFSYKSLKNHEIKDLQKFCKCCIDEGPINIIKLKNFPKDKEIDFSISRPFFSADKTWKIGSFTSKNLINDSIFINPHVSVPGERINVYFQTEDKKLNYMTTYIPNPIRGKNENGKEIFTLELMQISPQYQIYKIEISNLPEKEKIYVESVEKNGIRLNDIQVSKNSAEMIAVEGDNLKDGHALLSVRMDSGEIIKINLPWQEEMFTYQVGFGDKIYDNED